MLLSWFLVEKLDGFSGYGDLAAFLAGFLVFPVIRFEPTFDEDTGTFFW